MFKNGTTNKKTRLEDSNGFEQWGGYMGAKKSKLEEQFRLESSAENTLKKNIFNGISIFVNGYTVPSANKLKLMMMEYGGVYHHYYTNEKTTYMVASNLPACKIKQLKTVKVIKPEWVVDSISNGKMLDYRVYLLYRDKNVEKFKENFIVYPPDDKNETSVKGDEENYNMELSDDEIKTNEDDNNNNNTYDGTKVVPVEECCLKRPAKSASDSNFLNEFYNNSRLHHISTMSMTFKDYVTTLRLKGDKVFEGRRRFKEWKNLCEVNNEEMDICEGIIIMHIDMDCFFASVGIRNRSHLRGKPVAVTHAKGNRVFNKEGRDVQLEFNLYSEHSKEKLKSKKYEVIKTSRDENTPRTARFAEMGEHDSMAEVACCNYEAREYGIKNGMLLGRALKLCPNLNTIPYDFEAYKEVSYALFDHVASFTLDIEAVSCDEMFVDVTDVLRSAEATPMQFATFIRSEIRDITGCPCSTGFGSNILLARLATKKAKPDGQFYIHQNNVKDFLSSFHVSDLPGVGHSTASKLALMGISTCKDLQNSSVHALQFEFGNKLGSTLYKHANGEDDRKLNFDHQRKSVSADVNYGIRFQNESECEDFLKRLSTEVANRLDNAGLKGKCITLKLMMKAKEAPEETAKFMGHGVCDYFTKSVSLPVPTSDSLIILKEVLRITHGIRVDAKDMRGIGIQVSKLNKNTDIDRKCVRLDRYLTNQKVPKSETSEKITSSNKRATEPQLYNAARITNKKSIDFYFKAATENKSIVDETFEDSDKSNSNDRWQQSNADTRCDKFSNGIVSKASDDYLLHCDNNQMTNFEKNGNISRIYERNERSNLAIGLTYENNSLQEENLPVKPVIILSDLNSDESSFIKNEDIDSCIKLYSSAYVLIERNAARLKSSIPLYEMKDAIREWMENVTVPESCDIQMLADYLQCQIHKRNLESVDILLRFVHRMASKKNAVVWQHTYKNIVNEVQKTMLLVYGKTLMILEMA